MATRQLTGCRAPVKRRAAGAVYGAGMHPEHLIEAFGTLGLFAIVFAESGLLFGFFLPGDSLLFTAGLLASEAS